LDITKPGDENAGYDPFDNPDPAADRGGALPTWGYSGGWGYYPSGGIGLLLVIVVVLLLVGRI
jgi:hypothetical protein